MKSTALFFKNVFFFRRFQNKGYSIFKTLGKIVVIASLPIVYLQLWSVSLRAQDTVKMNNVIVNAQKRPVLFASNFRLIKLLSSEQIVQLPANSLSELLNFGGVNILRRSVDDIQSDLQINAAKSDQVLLLLNGFVVNDMQTGHFNMNLPVSIEDIKQVEVLFGEDGSLYGINAMGGAINFKTYLDSINYVKTKTILGSFNYTNFYAALNMKAKKYYHYLSFDYKKSDGYIPDTDFELYKAFYSNRYNAKIFSIFFQTGILWKDFGAFNFYTTKFPYQFEHNNTEFVGLSLHIKPIHTKLLISYRRNQDKFELFREGGDWYQPINGYFVKDSTDTAWIVPQKLPYTHHNYHALHSLSLNIIKLKKTNLGTTYFSVDLQQSLLYSTVLGNKLVKPVKIPFETEKYFNSYATRKVASVSLSHTKRWRNYKLGLYAATVYYDKFFYTGGINNSIELNKFSLFMNYNSALRYPSFTEMYYSDPVHSGNPNLKPERSNRLETGFKYFTSKIKMQQYFFYTHRYNLIDWQLNSDSIYYARNYASVSLYGWNADFYLSLLKTKNFTSQVWITGTILRYLNFTSGYYISTTPTAYYSFTVINMIYNGGLSLNTFYRQYTVNQSNRYTLLNLKLWYNFHSLRVSLTIDNLLDTKYQDYLTPMPGRWIKFALLKRLNF